MTTEHLIPIKYKERKPDPPLNPPIYDRKAALRWLEFTKRDEWWQSQMPVSVFALESALDKPGRLKDALAGDTNPDTILALLGHLIPDIEARKVVFPKIGRGRPKKGEEPTPRYLRLFPLSTPFIPKLSSNWSLWARCITCGGNKFLPVMIGWTSHAACYHCLPPDQYPSIGAKGIKTSLIHEALKEWY